MSSLSQFLSLTGQKQNINLTDKAQLMAFVESLVAGDSSCSGSDDEEEVLTRSKPGPARPPSTDDLNAEEIEAISTEAVSRALAGVTEALSYQDADDEEGCSTTTGGDTEDEEEGEAMQQMLKQAMSEAVKATTK